MTNDAARILGFWNRLEYFVPFAPEKAPDRVPSYMIKNAQSPYPVFGSQDDPRPIPCVYEVFFGFFLIGSALEAIDTTLGVLAVEDYNKSRSCFIKLKLDRCGVIDPQSIAVSPYPWAVQWICMHDMNERDWDRGWAAYRDAIVARFSMRKDPVDFAFWKEMLVFLSTSIDWKIEFAPSFLRMDRMPAMDVSDADVTAQRNELLPSFYVRDLAMLADRARENDLSPALSNVLTGRPMHSIDLEVGRDRATHLSNIFHPSRMPRARWPGTYPLRMMQQASVNLFMNPAFHCPTFSVNGPPGTGKTTLLRDIVAAVVLDRADALVRLDAPDHAFIDVPRGKWRIREVSDAIRGREILVTSNNNTAVENITRELPVAKAIPEKYRGEYGYFQRYAEQIHRAHETKEYAKPKAETWGLVAAVLGNRRNRGEFVASFWPDRRNGDAMRWHLKEMIARTPEQKRRAWQEARARYRESRARVEQEYVRMMDVYDAMRRLSEHAATVGDIAAERAECQRRLSAAQYALAEARRHLGVYEARAYEAQARLEAERREAQSLRGLWKRIVGRGPTSQAAEMCERCWAAFADGKQREHEASVYLAGIASEMERMDEYDARIAYDRALVNDFRATGAQLPSADYFRGGDREEEAQKACPWHHARLDELREKLFLEAMRLHQAFVEGSGYLYANLDAACHMLGGRMEHGEEEKHAATLFQSLFLVVPVLSSALASVGTLLRYVGREQIGYLFVDEAGQVSPQYAAGAMQRASRVIAVGDPLQIEPVVTLHKHAFSTIARIFGVPQAFAEYGTHLQGFLDQLNPYGGVRHVGDRTLWVGSPLRVHGRCQRTVFDISNAIAYNGKMIFASESRPEVCLWRHVVGTSQNKGHFVSEQARAIEAEVVDAFRSFAKRRGNPDAPSLPEIFIITPFRTVCDGARQHFKRELPQRFATDAELAHIEEKVIKDWVSEHIGTIHAFQGKETCTVAVLLGVSSADGAGSGAVAWASSTPNILNVAVTRAKERLYIVGDARVWNVQYFREAWRMCEKEGMG